MLPWEKVVFQRGVVFLECSWEHRRTLSVTSPGTTNKLLPACAARVPQPLLACLAFNSINLSWNLCLAHFPPAFLLFVPQFLCLKNIRTFLKVCHDKFGLRNSDLFDPFDLFDVRDFGKVRAAAGKGWSDGAAPGLGENAKVLCFFEQPLRNGHQLPVLVVYLGFCSSSEYLGVVLVIWGLVLALLKGHQAFKLSALD